MKNAIAFVLFMTLFAAMGTAFADDSDQVTTHIGRGISSSGSSQSAPQTCQN